MADPKEKDKKELTAADVAKLVTRTVRTTKTVKGEDGKPQTVVEEKQVAVKAAEVLRWRDHGTHVVVVTTDGQKLSSAAGA